MTIPSGQKWLKDYMYALKYDPTEEGICSGVSNVGMQAFQLEELDLFVDRLDQINDIPLNTFADEIENARKIMTAKDTIFSETIQSQALKKLDIRAFFEEILIYTRYICILSYSKWGTTSQDTLLSFKLLKPKALQEKV